VQAQADAATARAEQDDARARAALAPPHRELPVEALRTVLDQERELTVRLRPLAEVEDGLAAREEALAQRRAQHEEASSRARAAEEALAQLPLRREALVVQRDAAQAGAALVPTLEQDLARSSARHDAAVELVAAEDALADAQRVLAESAVALAEAEAGARGLADRYRTGIAAELAALLAPDEPCPVCGSCQHPAPVRPAGDHVARDHVEAAEAAVRAVRGEVEVRRQAVVAAQRRVEHRVAGADGLTPSAAAVARAEAEQALARARAAAAELVGVDEALAALEAERLARTEARTEALAAASARVAEAAALEDGLAADRAAVRRARGEHACVAERLAAVLASVRALAGAEAAARGVATAVAARAAAQVALASALAREGFADAEAATCAQLAPAERAVLEAQVRAHDVESAQVEGILAEPELAGVDADETIDPAPTAAALDEARAAHEDALAARGRATARLAQAADQAAAVRVAAGEHEACVARTEPLLAVARMAWGHNVLSMDLATYVLQRRFEVVVAAANEHLRVMSDGALALATSDEAEGRTRRAGLGLRVVDLRTGQERSPRTLSGGETFYTALALALGLAAVVTGEAGGVDLGTLFVDEGFGSLDSDTLDDVLAVLTSLRSNGRVIGVVSHVEEMKQRIPERIEVRRDEVLGHSAVRVVA
jgi:DNA repair protein SbcC/Rad50